MLMRLKESSGEPVLVNSDRITFVETFMEGSFVHLAGEEQAVKIAETPDEVLQAFRDVASAKGPVEAVFTIIPGFTSPGSVNTAFIILRLKDWHDRSMKQQTTMAKRSENALNQERSFGLRNRVRTSMWKCLSSRVAMYAPKNPTQRTM